MTKTILNTTRSSTERWTFFGDLTTGELVNGKNRYKFTDFCASDHPMKDTVLNWMRVKGLLPAPPVGWTSVGTSVEDIAVVLQKVPNLTTGPSLATIFGVTSISDRTKDRLVSMHFGDLNREKGKGATRKLRKQLRSMGYTRLAGLKAS